jgi:hypothetical protein
MSALLAADYRIPSRTVQLGTVLDLDCAPNARSRLFIDDWRNWLMCCDERGFDAAPGRARLWLLKVTPHNVPIDSDDLISDAAGEAFAEWHDREPDSVVEVGGLPDHIGHYQGRVLRIGYRSDKWHPRGTTVDYDHDCFERGGQPPKLYTSHARIESSRAAVIVGGTMHITHRGIE